MFLFLVFIVYNLALGYISLKVFSIILTQGLNLQIRRMSKALGYNVLDLERIRIMNIELQGLKIGRWRNLTIDEIKNLKNMIENV